MQFKDIVYAIGDFLEWTFEILPPLGHIPNFLFLGIGFILFIYWLGQMNKQAKRGEH